MDLGILIDEKSERKVVKRGFVEEDTRWFSAEAIPKLQKAQEELEWLLNRGYKTDAVIGLIGDRYQFSIRQRNALQRATAPRDIREKRKNKVIPYASINDKSIYIDGFNLIITLEVALSGGVLIVANDGTIRDIAGLRGTYSVIDKTDKALELIGLVFQELKIQSAKFFLDSPVSNSGRLKGRILEHAVHWDTKIEVELVPNADHILIDMERVVTSDSIILDKCISWLNLSRIIVEKYIEGANIVNLSDQKY